MKLTISDIVGHKVRLHSPYWEQGFCDGEVVRYDSTRGVFVFRAGHHTRPDDPYYEVRLGNLNKQFTLL
jgi:hypothetical protein